MYKPLKNRVFALFISIAGCIGGAQASPYSNLVFFGDSLSDTGNVLSLTTALAPPPFPNFPGASGRFSNGPVWTEYLASGLGLASASNPSNLLFTGTAVVPIGPQQGGQNFSYGGARTGLGGAAGPTTGLLGQLIAWNGSIFSTSLTRAADPNALYSVVAGANDLRDARSANPGSTAADAAARAAAAATTAANVTNALALLAQAGARHFLISNLPDLGRTPEAASLGMVPASTDVTLRFNADLAADAAFLDAQFQTVFGIDLDIRSLDFYGLTNDLYDDGLNHGGARYGITNVTTPCIAPGPFSHQYFFPDATGINCSVSAFSDPLHPSAAAHQLIGRLALAAAVPEPASLALTGLALVLVLGLRRAGVAHRPSPA